MNPNRRLINSSFLSSALALLALCVLTYIPMIYRLGFYWDDWPSIWFFHQWGSEGFRQGFSSDRPLLAWIFQLTSPIFSDSTSGWQYFGVATRWLTSLAWWWTMSGLWPNHPRPVFWAAALFAVYPGFSQQYISVTYSNAFIVFLFFLISLGSMIWAQRLKRWFWPLMLLSLITSAFSMLITEYFMGLELIRPFFLWFSQTSDQKAYTPRLKRVLLCWLPYLMIELPVMVWRLVFTATPRAQIMLFSSVLQSPFKTLFQLFSTILQDFYEVNFLAWFHNLDVRYLNDFDTNVLTLLAVSVVCSIAVSYLFQKTLNKKTWNEANEVENLNHKWHFQAVFLGIISFLVSGWTIWITDLHFELIFPFDRFTLITMVGTSLLIAGLLGLVDRRPWLSGMIFSLLIGLSTLIQFQHRLEYRQEWLSQKNFFWQLLWRAPAIQPGTTLMTSEIPFTYYSDNSLSAPLNWIYAPDNATQEMDYMLFDIEARLGKDLHEISSGIPIQMPYRASYFNGNTSKAIVLFYDPPRCLKVMDPAVDRFLPVKPLYIREAVPLSNLDLILSENQHYSKAIPFELFGPEPAPNWCYYFEKAELYAQNGKWDQVVEMAENALKITKHFTQKNVSELIPFIQGYAQTGNWKKALELSIQAYQIWDKTQYPLCDAWKSLAANAPESDDRLEAIQQIQELIDCRIN